MPRKKKDGRYINYFIDREIYEKLEKYADDKGQTKTIAIERILKEHLDKFFADNPCIDDNTTISKRGTDEKE